jgi:hypothetical protein
MSVFVSLFWFRHLVCCDLTVHLGFENTVSDMEAVEISDRRKKKSTGNGEKYHRNKVKAV